MGLKVKNFNILGIQRKNPSFRGGFTKSQYVVGLPKSVCVGGAWTVGRFKGGGLARNRGLVFLREG